MAQMLKVVVAGPLVIQSLYPMVRPSDGQRTRAGKRKLSSEAQQRMNLKYAFQKLELELAANFEPGDIVATFTYDDAHLPRDRREAQQRAQAFWRRYRQARGRQGADGRYLYVNEHKHGEGRWHHHAVLRATGEDYELIRRLWRYGQVEMHPFRVDKEKNYETLARYFCKEQREKVGHRLWSTSRGMRQPERESFRVPDDTQLKLPTGIEPIEVSDVKTPYGRYQYIKYLGAGWSIRPRVKARRRRRRPRHT